MRPCGTYDESYAQDMAIVRTRLQWILLIGGLILLALIGSGVAFAIYSRRKPKKLKEKKEGPEEKEEESKEALE